MKYECNSSWNVLFSRGENATFSNISLICFQFLLSSTVNGNLKWETSSNLFYVYHKCLRLSLSLKTIVEIIVEIVEIIVEITFYTTVIDR